MLGRRINSSGDIAIYRFWSFGLKLPIHAPFWGLFGAYFPRMTSLMVVIFPLFGGNPHWTDSTKRCMVGDAHDVITCVKFRIEIFMGYKFTGGRIFDFPVDFCMGLTTMQRKCAASCM